MKKNIASHFGLVLLILFSYFAIKPLFISGFFPMHDDTQPTRVFEMTRVLQDGVFPVRWVPDLGYGFGYPIFNFYGPLAYYFGSLFQLAGLDALLATKIIMGVAMVLAGFGMYLLARIFWGELGGTLAGLLYLYAPYHAVNLYVRGAVAELFGYAFIPFVFYGVWKSYTEKKWRYVVVGSLSYAAVISSHNLTAIMVTPFLLLTVLVLAYLSFKKSDKKAFYYSLSVFLGMLIAAFYWLPALSEMAYTDVLTQVGGKAHYADHFVCLGQLWESQWGFGGSVPGCVDGMSYRVGKLHIGLTFLSLLIAVLIRKNDRSRSLLVLGAVLLFLLSIFLTLPYAYHIWNLVPMMAFLQYPWRFLLMVSFFSSFLGGATVWFINSYLPKVRYRFAMSFFTFILLFAGMYLNYGKLFEPQTILPKTVFDYTSDEELKWNRSRISDEYMPKDFRKPVKWQALQEERIIVQSGNAAVQTVDENSHKIQSKITAEDPVTLHVRLAYFPGWQVFLNGKPYEYEVLDQGLSVRVPKGQHMLTVQFFQTPIEKLANSLSITGIAVLLVGIISPHISFEGKSGDRITQYPTRSVRKKKTSK